MEGKSTREIAETMEWSQGAISYNLRKHDKNGHTDKQKHPGRPEKLDKREKRRLVRIVQRDPVVSSEEAAKRFNEGRPENEQVTSRYMRTYTKSMACRHALGSENE